MVAVILLSLVSCAKKAATPGVERIAVLRFENLGSDSSLAWMGRAFSEVIASELNGAPGLQVLPSTRLHAFDRLLGVRPIGAPGISTESTQALLAGATRVVYGEYAVRNGKLEARITIEDPRTLTMTESFDVSAPAGDVLGAATAAAKRISPRTTAYGTANPEALSAYIQSLESNDAPHLEQGLTAAIKADPDFAPPYRLLAQERVQRGNRAGGLGVIEQALARGDRITGLERARLELHSAELSGDVDARRNALNKMVKLDPSDAAVWRTLGDSEMARHEYRRALEAQQQAAKLEPNETAPWNSIGYAAAYAGELETGMAALRRYQALVPNEANPFDSMGDINLLSGRLAEAERFYFEAHQKDPGFNNQGALLKAAIAHVLTGDVAGADKIAGQYFDARREAKDAIVEYRRAEWMWLTGHRKDAWQQMHAFAQSTENTALRDVASRADAELALWSLMMGDRAAAAQLAAKAVRIGSPAARGNAIVAAFLTLPPASGSEWSVRAEQQFGGPGQTQIKNFALAYALLVNQDFQAAQLLFKQMWDSGSPVADEGMPVMLAWSYLQTGKVKEAAPLLRFNPVPGANGLTPYTSFYLPRLFYLRGVLAEKEGRGDAAKAEFKKFLDLSGGVPLIWGDEKRVQ